MYGNNHFTSASESATRVLESKDYRDSLRIIEEGPDDEETEPTYPEEEPLDFND